eukprot:1139245-Pelagomonas_calceolata.AAC.2
MPAVKLKTPQIWRGPKVGQQLRSAVLCTRHVEAFKAASVLRIKSGCLDMIKSSLVLTAQHAPKGRPILKGRPITP